MSISSTDNAPTAKEAETCRLLAYLMEHPEGADVDELLANVELERLRIYDIIIDLTVDGSLVVTGRTHWGAPSRVRLAAYT